MSYFVIGTMYVFMMFGFYTRILKPILMKFVKNESKVRTYSIGIIGGITAFIIDLITK